jgi:nucleoside-diphosphate kinase
MDNLEQTLLLIKPDGVKRSLVGEILKRLERSGLKLIYARMIKATDAQARGNYPGTDEWLIGMGKKTTKGYAGNTDLIMKELGTVDELEIGKKIYTQLVRYLTSGPMIATVWQGNHAVMVARKLVGATDPKRLIWGVFEGISGLTLRS